MDTPAPIFEQTVSPLQRSNDGNLYVRTDLGHGKTITSEYGPGPLDRGHVVLFTFEGVIADAFIAGYDHAAKCAAVPVGTLFNPVAESDDVEGYSRPHPRQLSLASSLLCEDSALD